jgi:heterodisulfide reductase subunit A
MAGKKNKQRIGVFVCDCGMNISGVVDCDALSAFSEKLPGVVHVERNKYTCSQPGQENVKKAIAEHNLDRVVVAACTPRIHEPTFRNCVAEAGLNPYLMEMANIREHCSWVHQGDHAGATDKAKDLVRSSVARAEGLTSQEETSIPVAAAALVIGGGVAGIQSALDMADSGHKVFLVEKSPSIGGLMAQLAKTYPTMDCPT